MLRFLGIFLLFVAGCKQDPNLTKLQYMPDMVDGSAIKAQTSYILPPDGSVARTAVFYPKDVDGFKSWVNPLLDAPNQAEHLKKGEHMYQVNCQHCHGLSGTGEDGTIRDLFPPAANLMSEMYHPAEKNDGQFVGTITLGGAIMPPLENKTTLEERWQITLYVRHLQQKYQGK